MLSRSKLLVKILVIPMVAIVSLLLLLGMNTFTTATNQTLLENSKDVLFPVLQLADRSLVNLERSRESHTMAITTGDPDLLDLAKNFESLTLIDLNSLSEISPGMADASADLTGIAKDYINHADFVTSSLLETGDFKGMSADIEKLNMLYEELKSRMTTFRDSILSQFKNSIETANQNASSGLYFGLVVGI